MKKLLALTLLLTLTSCGGYESLKAPFTTPSKNINKAGADYTVNDTGAFEINVNAPAGTPRATALDLFDAEAKKVCKERPYKKVITSEGSAEIRDYGVKGFGTQASVISRAPTVKGFVECQ